MSKALLYGIHDPGGEHLLPKGSWIVFTESIGHNPDDLSGVDYRRWSEQGYQVIVRLNNGYGADGTIPLPQYYGDFARRCANFVKNSPGCTRWIVGNEPNHSQERPQGQSISAQEYAGCFKMVATQIFERVGEEHQVIVAAVAPWNVETGDWLLYMRRMLENLQGYADGIALHAYTHGSDPALIASEAMMDAPFERRRYHFRAYIDMMDAIPDAMRDLPVYITETDQDVPWLDANNGWVQAAYAEIDHWNKTPGTQKIHCLCLYRWPMGLDQWGVADKEGVHNGLREAVGMNYTVPQSLVAPDIAPPAAQPEVPVQTARSVKRDPRLDQRGVTNLKAQVPAGTVVYRLVSGEYMTPEESGGNPLIWVDVLDENGVRMVGAPVIQSWEDGDATQYLEAKPGEKAGTSFLMTSPGNPYHIHVGGGAVSDVVQGMGLGTIEHPWSKDHVGYRLVFQRTVAGQPEPLPQENTVHLPIISGSPQTPAAPVPQPSTEVVTPEQSESNWQRAYPFVLSMEGGLSLDPNDIGNWTGGARDKGQLKGTKYGISAASYPHLDIANLTKEQALEIYKRDYWMPSGAASMPWPLCLAVFDVAINHGVGAAQRIYKRELTEVELYMAKRMLDYITYAGWKYYAEAWGNRVRHLLDKVKAG